VPGPGHRSSLLSRIAPTAAATGPSPSETGVPDPDRKDPYSRHPGLPPRRSGWFFPGSRSGPEQHRQNRLRAGPDAWPSREHLPQQIEGNDDSQSKDSVGPSIGQGFPVHFYSFFTDCDSVLVQAANLIQPDAKLRN